MNERFQRQALLTGKGATEALADKHVIVFGVGGVGGYCCEALARCGIGSLTLVDNDVVSLSNINRQIIALTSTVGQYKTDVMAKRINDINPDCIVTTHNTFLTPENLADFHLEKVDYVADCIDTVTSKLALAEFCFKNGIPVISAMGAGNKLTSEGFAVRDLFKTEGCPLAKVMRRELKKRGVTKLKTVSSPTLPLKPILYQPSVPG